MLGLAGQRLDFVRPDGTSQQFVAMPPPNMGNRARLVTHSGLDLGMLLSHECVVDKGGHAPITFARILPITTASGAGRDAIRNGANYQAFYLPGIEGLVQESYVDFRLIVAIDPSLASQFRRIASLTQEGRDSLRIQLILYWTRLEPMSGPKQLPFRSG